MVGAIGGFGEKTIGGLWGGVGLSKRANLLAFHETSRQAGQQASRQQAANKYFWWNSVNKVCDCLSPDEAMRMLPYETKISSPALISFVALWCQSNKHTSTTKQGERKTVSQKCKIKLHNDKMFIVAYYEA